MTAILTPVLAPAVAANTARSDGPAPAELAGQVSLERKYVFPDAYGGMLGDWLSASLPRDPAFSAGVVTSLYFDTPDLRLYQQKRNSDYLKTKVRLRWYETDSETVPCFMEIKKKIGAVRNKVRVPVAFSRETLTRRAFTDPEVGSAPLHADPYLRGLPLVPMFLLQYRRRRFVDPITGVRVALDTAVQCLGANPAFLSSSHAVSLAVGVLETKGVIRELPRILAPISCHLRKEAFSKYAICCEHMLQPLARRV